MFLSLCYFYIPGFFILFLLLFKLLHLYIELG